MDQITFNRIAEAGRRAGKMDSILRFATEDERDAWHENACKELAAILAPVDDEPFDTNVQGDKIAERFAEIHTFEIYRINNRRCIIGDFATYEEYEAHVEAEWEALLADIRKTIPFWAKEE